MVKSDSLGDAPMSAGYCRIEFGGFAKLGAVLARTTEGTGVSLRRGLIWLPAALLVGAGAWLLLPASDGHGVGSETARLELASLQSEPAATDPVSGPSATVPAATAGQTPEAAELDRLRISSQSWRRGGLGSKALVTFTLRNDNDYAVKDVEISCSFVRRDGSHLTDRRRVLPETVNMKSRKTFARVHIGFVNVNASQAKCSLAAARRA